MHRKTDIRPKYLIPIIGNPTPQALLTSPVPYQSAKLLRISNFMSSRGLNTVTIRPLNSTTKKKTVNAGPIDMY